LAADHGLLLRVLDIEGTEDFVVGHVALRGAAGVRWARMLQEFFARETGGTQESIRMLHDFEGLGPTVFLEAARPTAFRGLGFFANGRASVLFGESEVQGFEDEELDFLIPNHDDLLAVLECQVGAEWNLALARASALSLRAALEGQIWFDAGSGNAAGGAAVGRTPPDIGDLGFVGFLVSANLTY
jgi:hypothetical protein